MKKEERRVAARHQEKAKSIKGGVVLTRRGKRFGQKQGS